MSTSESAVWDAIVFGAGIEGSATAYTLQKSGVKTLLLEQFLLPHTRGSSSGQSRIIRKAYDTEIYAKMMLEAYDMWFDLEKEADIKLINRNKGLLKIEKPPFRTLHTMKNSFDKFNLPYSWLSYEETQKQFPTVTCDPDCNAFFDPEAGSIIADRAVRTYQDMFVKYGGTLLDDRHVVEIIPGNIVQVITKRGSYRAKHLMILPGPWAGKVLRPLGLNLPIKAVRVNVCFFPMKDEAQPHPSTVHYLKWSSTTTKTYLYTVPSEFPGYIKAGIHDGHEVDPDRPYYPEADDIERIKDLVSKYVPSVQPVPAVVEPCMYTITPDEDLILDRHPIFHNLIIAAGFAGHGFKLAPIIGKIMLEMLHNLQPSYDLSRFSMKRFNLKSSAL